MFEYSAQPYGTQAVTEDDAFIAMSIPAPQDSRLNAKNSPRTETGVSSARSTRIPQTCARLYHWTRVVLIGTSWLAKMLCLCQAALTSAALLRSSASVTGSENPTTYRPPLHSRVSLLAHCESSHLSYKSGLNKSRVYSHWRSEVLLQKWAGARIFSRGKHWAKRGSEGRTWGIGVDLTGILGDAWPDLL